MTTKTKLVAAMMTGSISIGLPMTALAVLEEVIVTAQKREQSLQEVPIAINALAGDSLDDFGIQDTDDIVALYPNMSLNKTSAYNSGVAIRGVGTDSFHISGQQSVGSYIDGVSAVSPFVSQIGIFDMERIEILRGPQNTLYGRNTTAGAINYITRKAEVGAEANGYLQFESGENGRSKVEGAYGLPINDSLALRISGTSSSYDGQWKSLATGMI